MKIFIQVEGGCVVDVRTDDPNFNNIEIMDVDNLEMEIGRKKIDRKIEQKEKEYPYSINS